ncbi:hypothetical protein BAZ12_00600 [Elizabethkingia miricola]|uniref:Acb2/Tad1 domain-containing protein n=1 Tax=Elizabethkingia TaxID=308865 RepID=UPI0008401D56|nr:MULTISPECIES: hypothetical protein [Elizabethkingia]MCL1652565.1 hypothetical protein [Elizabethkingia miricola]OCW73130.1 hypothetical protein A4G24_15760 [Elizabethkingia anophelis]OPC71113.1 hypothetical protein BAZ13_09700 [Elizabethkingia miricola]OPC75574.1 hypothetical protein BAZ12_00600 [Elizabethkingia miricola]
MEKTLGQIRVRTDFNVTKADNISLVKQQTANLIDMLEDLRKDNRSMIDQEKQRLISITQSKYEEAAMFAVKALTTEN